MRAATALLALTLAAPASAQQAPDFNFLDQAARERNAHLHLKPQTPLPAAHEVIRPTRDLWVCMSTDFGLPVRQSPNPNAPQIGITMQQVATTGGWVNGYAEVLHYNGRIGWVQSGALRPYRNQFNSNATCTVPGVRLNGTPVFAIR